MCDEQARLAMLGFSTVSFPSDLDCSEEFDWLVVASVEQLRSYESVLELQSDRATNIRTSSTETRRHGGSRAVVYRPGSLLQL